MVICLTKFKVGDRVRCVKVSSPNVRSYVGVEGIVKEVRHDGKSLDIDYINHKLGKKSVTGSRATWWELAGGDGDLFD